MSDVQADYNRYLDDIRVKVDNYIQARIKSHDAWLVSTECDSRTRYWIDDAKKWEYVEEYHRTLDQVALARQALDDALNKTVKSMINILQKV